MNYLDLISLALIGILFLLILFPLTSEASEDWVVFVTYGIAIVAVYESVIHSQWKFITLITTSLLIHLVSDSCKIAESCINEYDASDFGSLEKYFTLYGLLHLIAYVSFNSETVEVFVPILVFVSLISVNLNLDSLLLAMVGIISFVNLITNKAKYYIEDTIAFLVFIFLAALFYFLKIDKDVAASEEGNGLKRFFVYFYFLAFIVSTGIKKEGLIHNMRLFERWCGGSKANNIIIAQVVQSKTGYAKVATTEAGTTRIDLKDL